MRLRHAQPPKPLYTLRDRGMGDRMGKERGKDGELDDTRGWDVGEMERGERYRSEASEHR